MICNNNGQCDNEKEMCQCEDKNADPSFKCSKCKQNYQDFEGKCYENKCKSNCFGLMLETCQFNDLDKQFQCLCQPNSTFVNKQCACNNNFVYNANLNRCIQNKCGNYDCNKLGTCLVDQAQNLQKCICFDEFSSEITQCTTCIDGYLRNEKDSKCYVSECKDQDNNYTKCNENYKCVIQNGEKAFKCVCDDEYAIFDNVGCQNCQQGYQKYDDPIHRGTCSKYNCENDCNDHGICVVKKAQPKQNPSRQYYEYVCWCYANYSIESSCKECNINFDPDQACLVCKSGHIFSQETGLCKRQQLSSKETFGVVIGVASVILMIVGIIYLVILRKNRFQILDKEEDLDEDEEQYV
ncbi:Teneurin-4 [Hexamita inflata]|uniref:Teneurin-4 n=1 Tax=Hexamita inflata TaxID=28002 RepID=A0AA86V6W5_9EUKA|nr:Teneurin-4 [Hexamita inflata]